MHEEALELACRLGARHDTRQNTQGRDTHALEKAVGQCTQLSLFPGGSFVLLAHEQVRWLGRGAAGVGRSAAQQHSWRLSLCAPAYSSGAVARWRRRCLLDGALIGCPRPLRARFMRAVQGSGARMVTARSKKIVKEKGLEPDEFEEQVAQVREREGVPEEGEQERQQRPDLEDGCRATSSCVGRPGTACQASAGGIAADSARTRPTSLGHPARVPAGRAGPL